MKCEITIIGGGPAGLISAILLAQQKFSVVVCEKNTYPIIKACGEGIMPPAARFLENLGISKTVSSKYQAPFYGVRYLLENKLSAECKFKNGPGLGMHRAALSNALYLFVQKSPHITLLTKTKIVDIKSEPQKIDVYFDGGSIESSVLVGADGLHSWTKKKLGLNGSSKQVGRRYGMSQHFAIKPWTDFVEIYFAKKAEAYITPCGDNMINVALLWHSDNVSTEITRGGQGFQNLLSMFPQLENKLRNADAIDKARAAGPMFQPASSIIAPRAALVGDASGYIDAITGEGISQAYRQGLVLSDALKTIGLKNELSVQKSLQTYAACVKKELLCSRRLTQFMLKASRHSRLVYCIILLLKKFPFIFQMLIRLSVEKK